MSVACGSIGKMDTNKCGGYVAHFILFSRKCVGFKDETEDWFCASCHWPTKPRLDSQADLDTHGGYHRRVV